MFPCLFSSYCRSVNLFLACVVSDHCNQSFFDHFYVVFLTSYWGIDAIFNAGVSSTSFFASHIESVYIISEMPKMPKKCMKYFRLLFDHLEWIEHQFLSGIRDSRKPGGLWGMMRGVGGVRKSIHSSRLAKGLGLGLLCWGFKGVQEGIRSEDASTLQIGSVAFPPEQCTSPQLHPLHRLFDQDGIKTVSHHPYSPDLAPSDFWLFPKLRGCPYETIEEMKEAVTKVLDTLTQEDFHRAFQKLLKRYKFTAAGGDYLEGD